MKIITEKVITESNWSDFVQKTYGRIYKLQQQEGCRDRGNLYITVPTIDYLEYDYKNLTVPEEVNGEEMGVSFAAWLERNPEAPIKNQQRDFDRHLWWTRNFYPAIEVLTHDLHSRGLLEAGKYTIKIDW